MARPTSTAPKDTSTATIGFEAKLWLTADKLRWARAPINHVVLGLIFLRRAERDNRSAAEIAPQIDWKTSRGKSRASVTRRASWGLRVKYISDTFEEHRAKLLAGQGDYAGANAEDPDEPSGANRVERDSLHEVQPARAGAEAHGKQPAAGSPKGQRGGAEQYKAENVFWVPAEARWSHLQGSAKLPTIGKLVDDAMVAIERDNPRLKGVLPKDYARPGLDRHRSQTRRLPERRAVVANFATTQIERRLNP